jgi:hypothetical protein
MTWRGLNKGCLQQARKIIRMTKERRKDLDYKNEMDLTETSSEDVN